MSRLHPNRWPLWWGVLGFVALLTNAVIRLAPVAFDALRMDLDAVHYFALAAYCVFMAYSEGYKGFHRQASPRVVERGLAVSEGKAALWKVLAPIFCMGLVGASKKRLVVSWAIVAMIVVLIIGVRMLSQPWRGIIDAGVVLGLAMGVMSTLYYFVRALAGSAPGVEPDLPVGWQRATP